MSPALTHGLIEESIGPIASAYPSGYRLPSGLNHDRLGNLWRAPALDKQLVDQAEELAVGSVQEMSCFGPSSTINSNLDQNLASFKPQ